MTPEERIERGLTEVHEAIVELRQEHEVAAREQEHRRGVLVTAEMRARALSMQAGIARRPRHLQPGERFGPHRRLHDGQQQEQLSIFSDWSPVPSNQRVSPVDAKTQESLVRMGLARAPKPKEST